MRIVNLYGQSDLKMLGVALLLCLTASSARAASFAIDPDPASPTLGEMLEREARKPGQNIASRTATISREQKTVPAEITRRGQSAAVQPAARIVTAIPSVPRDASTVVLPRPPQRPPVAGQPREVRRIDLSAPRPNLASPNLASPNLALVSSEMLASSEITNSVPPAASLRTETLPLGDVPFLELTRVMRAAEFDAVRYPLRHVEGGSAVSIKATPDRIARVAQLITLLRASRNDTAVISLAQPGKKLN